jgi:hypothetical protein
MVVTGVASDHFISNKLLVIHFMHYALTSIEELENKKSIFKKQCNDVL